MTEMNAYDKLAVLVNVLPFIFGGVVVFTWRNPHPVLVMLIVLYPLMLMFVCFLSEGKIRYIKEKNSFYPDVSLGMVAIFILQLIIADRYMTVNVTQLLLWSTGYAVAYILIAFIFFGKAMLSSQLGLFMFILALLYSVNSVKVVNGLFDVSEPKESLVSVTGFYSTGGRSKSYYLYITAYESDDDSCYVPEKIKVGRVLYNKVKKGDSLKLSMHEGCLNIPWYTCKKNGSL